MRVLAGETSLACTSLSGVHRNFYEPCGDLRDTMKRYAQRAWKPIPPGQKGPQLLWINLDRLLASILNRSRHTLTEGIFCFHEGGIVSSFLLARSALEITGAACYLLKKLRAHDDGNLSIDELDKSTEQLTLGERYRPEDPKVPPAISVLTMVAAADTFCASLDEGLKGKMPDLYDFLSEFVHPNHIGLRLGTEMDEHGVLHFAEGAPWGEHDVVQVLSAFNIAGSLTLRACDEGKHLIDKHRPQGR